MYQSDWTENDAIWFSLGLKPAGNKIGMKNAVYSSPTSSMNMAFAHHCHSLFLHTVSLIWSCSFSHGFSLLGFWLEVSWPVNTVSGICWIPGIGWPVVMSSTMCAKDDGYIGSCGGVCIKVDSIAWRDRRIGSSDDSSAPAFNANQALYDAGWSGGDRLFFLVNIRFGSVSAWCAGSVIPREIKTFCLQH